MRNYVMTNTTKDILHRLKKKHKNLSIISEHFKADVEVWDGLSEKPRAFIVKNKALRPILDEETNEICKLLLEKIAGDMPDIGVVYIEFDNKEISIVGREKDDDSFDYVYFDESYKQKPSPKYL